MKDLALGIDTSNYKTSIAVVGSNDEIILDLRRFLDVKKGERGLRQQEAFFQHVVRLPEMIESCLKEIDKDKIQVISVSDKPRPVDSSYMPCFMAGVSFGKVLAEALDVPLRFYSHQEGHIMAAKRFTELKERDDFVCFHFSGGTTEAIRVKDLEILGGTKDISYGQLIDRIGVAMGMGFPAGEEMDELAIRASEKGMSREDKLPQIKTDFSFVNLSGIETAALKLLKEESPETVSFQLFNKIGKSMIGIMDNINKEEGIKDFLFSGGVSESRILRGYLKDTPKKGNYNIHFSENNLSSDNAIGIAFLGGDDIWA